MFVEVYILCWNEEKILPYTLNHYSEFCDRIVLLDNYSNDSSLEISAQYPKVELKQWEVKGQKNGENASVYDERMILNIKENCFKQFGRGADWVIVADADEFYYHPDILSKLEELMYDGVNHPRVEGYEMISEKFPAYTKPMLLTDLIKTGVRNTGMDKRLIFDPRIGYGSRLAVFGGHLSEIREDLAVEGDSAEIKLLHYKSLSPEYKIERQKQLLSRRSDWTEEATLCEHWEQTEEQIRGWFKDNLKNATVVI